jgi:hypothetical protein
MKASFAALLAMIALLAVAGCGPSLATLIKEKRYNEAMCEAIGGKSDERATVADLLLEDAELRLDVRPVTAEAIAEAAAPALKAVRYDFAYQKRLADLTARFVLLEVRVMRRKLPVHSERMTLAPRGGSILATPMLARMTGEELPPQRTVCGGDPLSWLGRGKLGAGACEAKDEEPDAYRGRAPLAAALSDDFATKQKCTGRATEDCLHYVVVDTTTHGTASLYITLEWSTDGVGCPYAKRTAAFVVRLGDVASVRETVAARFGRGARAMKELDVEYESGGWTRR